MAAYISVPRDLTRVKSKILFNLTKRQLICFSVAAIVGVPVFFLLKRTGNVSLATLGMMLVMLPMFFLGMYEKDGQPLEKIAQHFIKEIQKSKGSFFGSGFHEKAVSEAAEGAESRGEESQAGRRRSPDGPAVHSLSADVPGRYLPRYRSVLHQDNPVSGYQLPAGSAGGQDRHF